jgi:hypothetical protein
MGMIRGLLKGDKGLFDFYTPRKSFWSNPIRLSGGRYGVRSSDDAKFKDCSEYYVDVVDTARLHAIALLAPSVRSQRIFAFAGPLNITDVISTLRVLRPDCKFDDPPTDEGQDFTEVAPAGKAERLLQEFFGRKGWTPYQQSIADGIRDL